MVKKHLRGYRILLAGLFVAAAGGLADGVYAKQRNANIVVVAVAGDPGHLNPAISTAGPLHTVADSLYNGLVALDAEGTPQPDLAKSWDIAEDGLSATFKLYPAKWHDGQPVTSADVKFSFEELLFKLHARTRAGLAPAVAAIETPDPETVVFRFKQPQPSLLRQIDVTEAPILPRHVYAGGDPLKNAANLKPVGSGAFRFESYRKDESITLVRNDDYFKAGLPQVDRLVFRVIPDMNTQILALNNDEVDYIGRVSPADIARVSQSDITTYNTTAGPGGANCIMTLSFNLQRAPLSDLRVRKAFAHAIDRRKMLEQVVFNQGRVADAPISTGIGWAHLAGALKAYAFDAAIANRLLDEAGLKRDANGIRASFEILHFPQFSRYSELMRQSLAAVGIALQVRTVDPAALAATVFTRREFDLALISYCNGTDPVIGVRRMYHSVAIGNVPFSNAAAYSNSKVDALFDKAGSAGSQAERGGFYRQAQEIIAKDLPYWWLVETDFTAAYRKSFQGFRPWSGQFAEQARKQP